MIRLCEYLYLETTLVKYKIARAQLTTLEWPDDLGNGRLELGSGLGSSTSGVLDRRIGPKSDWLAGWLPARLLRSSSLPFMSLLCLTKEGGEEEDVGRDRNTCARAVGGEAWNERRLFYAHARRLAPAVHRTQRRWATDKCMQATPSQGLPSALVPQVSVCLTYLTALDLT